MQKHLWIFVLVGAAVVAGISLGLWAWAGRGEPADDLAASDDAERRKAAAAALAEEESDQAVETLVDLARDEDHWVAVKAVRSLGKMRSERRREALRILVADTSVPAGARGEAAEALGKDPEVNPRVLTKTLLDAAEPKVRLGAAKGLARLKRPSTLPELVAALEDPDPDVRVWANNAIHRMIVRHFPFDGRKPPQTQRHQIERIKAYLRSCGMLK